MGLKEEFETAVVNKPSVFQPLKVYCRYLKYFGLVNVYNDLRVRTYDF